jgi:pentatricopeptide repeat protein
MRTASRVAVLQFLVASSISGRFSAHAAAAACFCSVFDTPQSATQARKLEQGILNAGRSGNWRKAISLLDDLNKVGNAASTTAHNNAAAACHRAGKLTRALDVLDELKESGGAWDAASFSLALTVLGKRGEWQAALQMLRSTRNLAPASNAHVYSAAIGACASSARWSEALSLLSSMEKRGVQPTARCYNGAILACAKASRPEDGLELLQQMRERGGEAAPTEVSYSTVLSSLGRKPGDWASQTVKVVLQTMETDSIVPSTRVYGSALLAYGRSGAWEDALELLRTMSAQSVPMNQLVMCNVLNACAQGGAWEEALRLVSSMGEVYGVEPDVACVNTAIKACARAKQWTAALELVEGLGDEANERSYLAALDAATSCLRWREALELLDRVHQTARRPNTRAFMAVIDCCIGRSQWRAGIEVFEKLHQARVAAAAADAMENATATEQGEVIGAEAEVLLRTAPRKESKNRFANAQLIRVITLHDELRRDGTLQKAISFEAALTTCEDYSEGDRLQLLLESLKAAAQVDRMYSWGQESSSSGGGNGRRNRRRR